jgi:hypothetical protein
MTPEEWNAIPEVGMPDEAHVTSMESGAVQAAPIPADIPAMTGALQPAAPVAAAQPVAGSLAAGAAAAAGSPHPTVPHTERPVTIAVPVDPVHIGTEMPVAPPHQWSAAATSAVMRPSIGSRLRSVFGGASSSTTLHVRAPERVGPEAPVVEGAAPSKPDDADA